MRKAKPVSRDHGNIYTPRAGSMIIQVQRESALASRTIVLSERKVHLLRFINSRSGLIVLFFLAASWFFFALQALRVPVLTHRVKSLQHDASKLDTLQLALTELQQRYEQIQQMLGVTPLSADSTHSPGALPLSWPVAEHRFITRGAVQASVYSSAHPGLDIALPVGTTVTAAASGVVSDLREDAEYGTVLRISHSGEIETLYGHNSRVLVRMGQQVKRGDAIALSGNTGRSTGPHLHFEIRRGGQSVDPTTMLRATP